MLILDLNRNVNTRIHCYVDTVYRQYIVKYFKHRFRIDEYGRDSRRMTPKKYATQYDREKIQTVH